MEIELKNKVSPEFKTRLDQYKFKDLLVILFLFFLPFSQALTLNIVFPLKLSEIFLFLLLFHELLSGSIVKWRFNLPVLIILIFFVLVFISVVVNFFYQYNYPLSVEYSRISPVIDSLLKFFYLFIAIVALIITRNAIIADPQLIRWFFIGASVASFYAWYLFFSGILHLPTLILPGMDPDPQKINLSVGDIIRCGTFKEGNYMGFFLLVSGIVALYYKKKMLSIFFFLTIITTFSTTSIFCLIIFLVIYLARIYRQYRTRLVASISGMALVLILLIQFNEAFRTNFYNKVFGDEDSIENANDLYSKADRLNTSWVGVNIFMDNPVFGIGLANYGLHYIHYNTLPELDVIDQTKRIPNDIYVEILSECGSLAFIAFLVFLSSLYKYGKPKSNGILTAGLIACFVYFIAFPTFTMLFIWVFFGIILA